jgi:hypothetical protein
MLQVLSNADITAREEKEADTQLAIRDVTASTENPVVSGLAAHIRVCWEQAKRAKIIHEQQILKNLRQKEGIYEPQKLAAIRSMKSSEVFMKLTDRKCRDAKDWIKDIIFQPGTKPWTIEPTPVPEVPEWVKQHAEVKLLQQRMGEIMQQAAQTGQQVPMEIIPEIIKQEMPGIMEHLEKEIKDEAKDIAKKMEQEIDDELIEGGFYTALADAIPDIILHTGFIKGPIYRKVKVPKLVADQKTGRKRLQVTDEIRGEYEKVNPLDIYPAPDATGINDGYLIEKTSLNGVQLQELRGVPTYDTEAIDKVLELYGQNGLREWTAIDTQRAEVEHRDQMVIHDTTKIDCLVFWGEIQGKVLLQWGMSLKEVPEPFSFYHVCVWLIGNYVIKAMLNPDDLGERPYYKAGFDETDGNCYWARGLPQVIDHIQEPANAVARHIVNNVGFAAGPMVEINEDRVPGAGDPAPNRVWRSNNDTMATGAPAIQVWSIPLIADKLMEIFDKYRKMMDEDSGIPAYAHGDADVGGGGDTASGLSMLMTAASRGIKGIIRTIDQHMIEPVIRYKYYRNIQKVENAALVGDYKVKAIGSSSLIAKEQQAMRRGEFLKTTQNTIDYSIMGPEGRRYLLEDTARALELDPEKAVPEAPPQPPQAGMVPGGPSNPPLVPTPGSPIPQGAGPAQPATLDQAGNPVAGKDFNLQRKEAAPLGQQANA